MQITYSESPSFECGWWIQVDTRSKKIAFRLLPRDAYHRVSSEIVRYEKYFAIIELEPEEDVILSQLMDKVQLRLDQQTSGVLDGTLQALSFQTGSSKFIGIEWNSKLPRGCVGVEEVVEKMREFARKCRATRDTGPSPE